MLRGELEGELEWWLTPQKLCLTLKLHLRSLLAGSGLALTG